MTSRYLFPLLLSLTLAPARALSPDTLRLDLQAMIEQAHLASPSVQSARSTFLSAYWNYRYFKAGYLPSLTLASSPYVNKEIGKITQPDGTALFLRADQLGADLSLQIDQNVSLTGGRLFLKSSLSRLDEHQAGTTAYSSQPVTVGYAQSLFGYNTLKWDKRIEPLRYREAKKQYAETLEIVSATTCSHFFSLLMAQTELDMALQNFASADTLYRLAQGRYEVGTITENEMLQLEINRLSEETNVMNAQINLSEVMQGVRSFLGLKQDRYIQPLMPDSVPQFEVSLAKALDLAMQNSPDPDYYRRIQAESEAALAQAKAGTGLRADLYVQFGLSQTGRDLQSSYHNLKRQEYASISLSLPILDWGRGKGRIRVAKSQLALTENRARQGMDDFQQNVRKLVLQFNMQARKVRIAVLTDRRASHRHAVARRLYIMGRSSILDLNAALSEKNSAKRAGISALSTFWSLYYTLRSMTAYDFERSVPLSEELPIK